MSNKAEIYLLDTNAFIEPSKKFYPFDGCPGYWDALKWHRHKGVVLSLDKVSEELEKLEDDLSSWTKTHFGKTGFAVTTGPDVIGIYGKMSEWVAKGQYSPAAMSEFLGVADGWLAAYAKAKDCIVVTLEKSRPETRRKVPLPDLCHAFDVASITPYEMLRRLGVKFSWQPPI